MRALTKLSAVFSIALAVVVLTTHTAAAEPVGRGYDVSWPQCGRTLPSRANVAIVGVNGGKPYEENPCLAEQFRWATGAAAQRAFYMNTANPGTASRVVDWYNQKSPNRGCSRSDEAACAYNYGFNAAKHAYATAQAKTGVAGRHSWWLDVETTNSWSDDQALNVADILGSLAYLRSQKVPVGVYSTGYQWGVITGGADLPDLPNWVAGARNGDQAARWCSPDSSFTGGPVTLVQWVQDDLDHNALCAPLPAVTTGPPPNQLDQLLRDLVALDLGGVLADLGLTPRAGVASAAPRR
jgi:hypothetical protein